ncbi:MAG: type II secretion system F family protein, partial [Acidimicrobiia bacterium]
AGPRRRGVRVRRADLSHPEALDRLAAHLRARGTVLAGLRELAGGTGALAENLRAVVARVDGGATLAGALARWREECPGTPELAVAGALEVTQLAGGGVAGALEGLAAGLRDSLEGARELRAQAAQARVSAAVVGLAPLGVLGLSLLGDRRVAAALVGTAGGWACLLGGLGLEALAALWMRHILRRAAAVRAEVPLAADLLAMALSAGLTPHLALGVVARCAPPRVGVALAAPLSRGGRLVDALETDARDNPELEPVLRILVACERFGAPAAPGLRHLAGEGRARLRQEAMVRARRASVHLLFPLVFLVLPAFLVLTVAPVLLAGFTR